MHGRGAVGGDGVRVRIFVAKRRRRLFHAFGQAGQCRAQAGGAARGAHDRCLVFVFAVDRLTGLGQALLGRGQLQAYRLVTPEFFQVVIHAQLRLHDVDDGVATVDQHPFARFQPFHRNDMAAGVLDGIADRGGQRLGLAVRAPAGDHHPVEQLGQVGGVVHLDVLRFDIFEAVDDGALQFANIHGAFFQFS